MMSAISTTGSRGDVSSTLAQVPKRKAVEGEGDPNIKAGEVNDSGNLGEFLNKISTHPKKEGEASSGSGLAARSLGKEDFLKFFMASLKNQDPSKPVDAEQFSSQMAQFSSLEQLVNLNKGIEKLVDGNKQDKTLQAMSLVGKEVAVDASKLDLKNGMLKPIQLTLPNDASHLKVAIFDANGTAVRNLTYEGKSKGGFEVLWDGKTDEGQKAGDGKYSYKVEVTEADGKKSLLSTERKMVIDGVDLNSKGDQVFSGEQVIKMDDVKKVFSDKKKEPTTKDVINDHLKDDLVSKKSTAAGTANFKKLV